MDKKTTLKTLQSMKGHEKIVMVTAYDALFASLFDEHVDVILIGDSLNMTFGGQDDTLSISMEQMIYHAKAVCSGAKKSFVLLDMPFGTCGNKKQALKNATKAYKQTKVDAVKIEGGREKAEIVKYLTDNEIAVCGHVGLKPQSARGEGGYSVKGKSEDEKKSILEDAIALEAAGAIMIVIEGVKPDVALAVTKAVKIPTIGIGAGVDCDGQVLVWSDMLGLNDIFVPKFVKRYTDGSSIVKDAIKQYADEVKKASFPNEQFTY
ncbi:MAG: 3-methyl-2-oxobutanoate hydroxymethyltransferase [Sulfurovaceae bacterium]|nr:3-methyl-2-oxobutanoate hydroxymethyltransferase [Sulfurovaceae bacterium]MDD5548278.1 3-methyl-2-oxobutanoate hydroxymethyltransferase [Sulfurovaceae bacterium]